MGGRPVYSCNCCGRCVLRFSAFRDFKGDYAKKLQSLMTSLNMCIIIIMATACIWVCLSCSQSLFVQRWQQLYRRKLHYILLESASPGVINSLNKDAQTLVPDDLGIPLLKILHFLYLYLKFVKPSSYASILSNSVRACNTRAGVCVS